MRIAILSDIHGNSVGLDAVLADIKHRGGVDAYWVLGDLCAIGFDPIGVLERLSQLPNLTCIKGNADRYVSSHDLPPPTVEDATKKPNLIPVLMEVASNFHWTRGALDATGWTSWLRDLPFDYHTQLPDGTAVYLVHSQPNTDEDKGLNPARTDAELAEILGDVDAGLVCVGHFHMPIRRYWNNMQIMNPGSVSNTFHQDHHAYYVILEADSQGFDLTYYAIKYDFEQAQKMVRATLNMGNDYNIYVLSGQIIPSWKKIWDGKSHFPPIVTVS